MKPKGKTAVKKRLSPDERRLFRLAVLLKIAELLKERRLQPKTLTEKAVEGALRRFAREVLP